MLIWNQTRRLACWMKQVASCCVLINVVDIFNGMKQVITCCCRWLQDEPHPAWIEIPEHCCCSLEPDQRLEGAGACITDNGRYFNSRLTFMPLSVKINIRKYYYYRCYWYYIIFSILSEWLGGLPSGRNVKSSAEVKNECSCFATPPLCFQSLLSYDFAFKFWDVNIGF